MTTRGRLPRAVVEITILCARGRAPGPGRLLEERGPLREMSLRWPDANYCGLRLGHPRAATVRWKERRPSAAAEGAVGRIVRHPVFRHRCESRPTAGSPFRRDCGTDAQASRFALGSRPNSFHSHPSRHGQFGGANRGQPTLPIVASCRRPSRAAMPSV